MTDAEWLTCKDPQKMLEFLRGKASDRKLRLFTCIICRRLWHLLPHEACKRVVELAEKYLEGQATRDELTLHRDLAWEIMLQVEKTDGVGSIPSLAAHAVFYTTCHEADPKYSPECGQGAASDASAEGTLEAGLLRDIFGNPFKPVTFDPSWRSADVVSLAQAIYDDRAFDRLPVLADALEESGCTSSEMLEHCRGGEHVKGCWVVDLLLQKE